MWNLEKLQNNPNRHVELFHFHKPVSTGPVRGSTMNETVRHHWVGYFMTGGPSKEHGTNKPPPTRTVQGRSKRDTRYSFSLASVLAEQGVSRQEGPWVRVIGKRKPGNQSHHHKTQDCEPQGRAVLGSLSWLFSARAPFPSKESCFVRMCVSADNSIQSVTQEPTLGPWKGSPFLQQTFPDKDAVMGFLSVDQALFLIKRTQKEIIEINLEEAGTSYLDLLVTMALSNAFKPSLPQFPISVKRMMGEEAFSYRNIVKVKWDDVSECVLWSIKYLSLRPTVLSTL